MHNIGNKSENENLLLSDEILALDVFMLMSFGVLLTV